jgi:penicillin-binding protein 1B
MHRSLPHPASRSALALILGLALVFLAIATLSFVTRLNALRDLHATGPNWSFPSRVFSDGVPFTVGRTAPDTYLESELAARGYVRASRPTSPGLYTRTPDGFDIVLRGFPDELDPEGGGGPERVRVMTRDGRIAGVQRLGGITGAMPPDTERPPRLEPVLVSMLFDDERIWRSWVSLERVPRPVRDAIVASEDRRFYGHLGVDPRGAARALSVNVKRGEVRQGGSTITQQLARGLFLGRERTWFRKLQEVPLAFGLELMLSKDQILEMYLNSVYWGQAQGFSIGGIAAASRWYFNAPVQSLGVLEGATLAAMIPSPNAFDPFDEPDRLRDRRNSVLNDLVETHRLSRAEADRLESEPVILRRGKTPTERFPSYSSYVNDLIDDVLRPHAATHFGLAIFTTMDLAWQEQSEDAVEAGLASLDHSSGRRVPLQGAFVALEPGRASVLAMVGGRAVKTGTFNRAYQARRQCGSAIKPIVYAAAYSTGLTPATTVPDTQRTFGRGRQAWRPHNFDNSYHPMVTLAKAMEQSLNLATTNLVERIGPHEVVSAAERFGLPGLKPVLSVGLGSSEVTLLQLTNAYAAFETQGMLRRPSPFRIVVDRTGREILGPPEEASEAVTPGIASLMTALMQNVVHYGVASPLKGVYGFDRPVAGKTGTTNDFHDAWFVGFTPEIAAGVWVGYDQPRSIGRQAAHTALPVWARAVGRLLQGFPVTSFATDNRLEWVNMDPWTGCLADSSSPRESTPFLLGTGPFATCEFDSLLEYRWTAREDSVLAADSLWHEEPDTLFERRSRHDAVERDSAEMDTAAAEPVGPPR